MRKLVSILLAAMLLLSLSATVFAADETIKVGGIGVLSGPYAQYGEACKNGIDLFIEETNAKGGINGKKIEMIWEDTEGDPTKAINAYNKLVDNDKVSAILGAVLTGETKAIAEYSADIGIPQITASATAYEITTGRPNVFRTCFLDPFQSVAIANYLKDEGITKAAAIYDNGDEYSSGLYKTFKAECEKNGIALVASESAAGSDVDFKAQLTNVKNAGPEMVFLPYYGATAALILAQAKELGLDVKFYGADGISDIVKAISDKSLLTNMVYTDHFAIDAKSEKAASFIAGYEKKYGEKPTIAFSATAYDAAAVLVNAFTSTNSLDFATVVKAIKESAVEGVTGKITFDDHNDPIKSAFFMTFDAEGNKLFIKQQNP